MRRDSKHLGSMEMSPTTDVIAGEYGTWSFVYTAGEYGIDDAGSIVLSWRMASDWGTPQDTDPKAPNYLTYKTTGDCRLVKVPLHWLRPYHDCICLKVTGGCLQKGETITITIGDRSGGSPGSRAQSFCEREHEWHTHVNCAGTMRYEELPEVMKVKILSGYANEIDLVMPGSTAVGEKFDIVVRALDEFGNPAANYDGIVKIELPENISEGIPSEIKFSEQDGGTVRINNCKMLKEGFYNIKVWDTKYNFKSFSNPCKVTADNLENLYFGDMHAQTKQTVGTGFLDDYYKFARDKGVVSFTGWQGNDFEITKSIWNEVREVGDSFNEEGKFLTYLGYEWSGTSPQGGDYNVFFLNDSEKFYPSSNWTSYYDSEIDVEDNANPLSELYEKFGDRDDVMLIPHIGGRYANLDYFNTKYSSVIEMHSHHGTFEWFIDEAMKRRMKVGFIAASDDHTCRPGLSYALSKEVGAFDVDSGYMGVFAPDLTKISVWNAIKARRCYASTIDRLFLDTRIGHLKMGQEGEMSGKLTMSVETAGKYPLEEVVLYDWDKVVETRKLMPSDNQKIRVRWSGVLYRGRGKSANWNGMLTVKKGCIRDAKEYGIDRSDQGIKMLTNSSVQWASSTSGDYDGLILDIEGDENTVLVFTSKIGSCEVKYADILKGDIKVDMGGLNLKVEFGLAPIELDSEDESFRNAQITFELPEDNGEHAYWVKVLQNNGNAAWASPIFVDRK